MRIPETPASVAELDLMKRLEDYAEGRETWHHDRSPLGQNAKKACRVLHTDLVQIVEQVFAYIMDRTTARELDTFTMHDRVHGRKAAHLMWHILTPERRSTLTPPEIGMMVLAAHLHDAGMALSRSEREARLAPGSDLWDRLEASPTIKRNLQRLRDKLADTDLAETKRIRIENELFQAEEALLALDTRERHALRERYQEIIAQIRDFHDKDRTRIPDIEKCFSFDGDSFKDKLVEVCVSHNEDADVLVEKDRQHFDRSRFPRDYPVGLANADTHMVAAALRLADILDFDRERTPSTLFHYLVPSSLSHGVNISELEWGKHLSISNWEIDPTAVVFRGRCNNHIVHHAVVQFCGAIQEEIASTRATFGVGEPQVWPFVLPELVRADIHEDGYHYVPYQFELDDGRVYDLLMGRAIYDNPLVAVRELVQNAVDACSYRDALSKLTDPHAQPDTENRITIRYEEPTGDREYPLLEVIDTGTGMDAWVIERWFLKVGRSYYSSTEFARDRVQLRKCGVDFAPVSEFGIGFLSCFLLADRVDVETAMWEPIRNDTRRRHLEIDGPSRLIRIREDVNAGLRRLRGTKVALTLVRGGAGPSGSVEVPPTWKEVRAYLAEICQDLPYRLNLERCTKERVEHEFIVRNPMVVAVPAHYRDSVLRIPVLDEDVGLEGEIAIVPYPKVRAVNLERSRDGAVAVSEHPSGRYERQGESVLLRGGFAVGEVPGLPNGWTQDSFAGGRVRMLWRGRQNGSYSPTNLARTAAVDEVAVCAKISEVRIRFLLEHLQDIEDGFTYGLSAPELNRRIFWATGEADRSVFKLGGPHFAWLQDFNALRVYKLARNGWRYSLADDRKGIDPVADWESGKRAAPLSAVGLCDELLGLVLPRVAPKRTLVAAHEGFTYLGPPAPGWQGVLGSCHDFISRPVRWSRFVHFGPGIPDGLHIHWLERLWNSKYESRMAAFSEDELDVAEVVFEKLIGDRAEGRPTELAEAQADLLRRLIDAAGDLEIRSYRGGYRLDSFRPRAA